MVSSGEGGDAAGGTGTQFNFAPAPVPSSDPEMSEPEESPRRPPEDETDYSRAPGSTSLANGAVPEALSAAGPAAAAATAAPVEGYEDGAVLLPKITVSAEPPTARAPQGLPPKQQVVGPASSGTTISGDIEGIDSGAPGLPGPRYYPPQSPLSSDGSAFGEGELGELVPPDDEVEHVIVPVARFSAKADLSGPEGEGDKAGNTDGANKTSESKEGGVLGGAAAADAGQPSEKKKPENGRKAQRAPKGICGESLFDRGLFVMEPGPENFPVLKPCPKDEIGRGRHYRAGLYDRGTGPGPRRSESGAGGGKEFVTGDDKDEEGKEGKSRGISPCPRRAAEKEGEEDEAAQQEAKAKAKKKRTWTYYPPPNGDEDAVPVDVIDHESEVLIVRRDPAPAPRRQLAMSVNVQHRSHKDVGASGSDAPQDAAPKGEQFLV